MEEAEFRRILHLFPVVRSRDYHIESDLGRQSTGLIGRNELREWQDSFYGAGGRGIEIQETGGYGGVFWEKLRLTTEKKVGKVEAEKFCKAFKRIHNQLVYKELSLDAARRFASSSYSPDE
ncbi:uncharacterized protein LOC124920286 [Impatiens glandulifera]|uniref:uncharacterized protein LOC124920286 n=1 Tax=Impatiens glandulifera TaxID=253017 RepID=UPI001FB13895|nr:uncharacterized protein LOC124920286 [Impatiens glandulifera]